MICSRPGLTLAACLALAGLAACQSTTEAPPAASIAAEPAAAPPPTGTGCGPSIARTQAIVASDVATGNLNEPVGQRFTSDLGLAAEACAAGRGAEGLRLLAAAKARYGYR